MESCTAANEAIALLLLPDVIVDREEELGKYEGEPMNNDSDEYFDSKSPITDLFYEKDSNQAILQTSKYNRQDRDGRYDIISDHVGKHYNVGCGLERPFTA